MKIVLDEKTKFYLETILNHKNDFYWLYEEIKKYLTEKQVESEYGDVYTVSIADENTNAWLSKLKSELDESFDWMEKIYNTYKE